MNVIFSTMQLFATNKNVKEFNHQKLKEFHQPVAYIPAIHNCSKAKSASAELSGGLEPFIICLLYTSRCV